MADVTLKLSELRRDYCRAGLDEKDVDPDPFRQFACWFEQAQAAELLEPNAMTIATVNASGQPSARIVLLKQVDERGLTFFTNYDSRKGQELADNPRVAALFFWGELERQVRIEGTVERVDRAMSEQYFHSRPRASQLGAILSRQSEVVASRAELERRMAELEQQYADAVVPLPDNWGGYRLLPTAWEFWQGRPSRVHDRLHYTRDENGAWRITRLSP